MSHPYFSSIDFDALAHRRLPAPFVLLRGRDDTANFDREFTSLPFESVEGEASAIAKATPAAGIPRGNAADGKAFRGFTFDADASGESSRRELIFEK